MALSSNGRLVVLNGLKDASASVRIVYQEYSGASFDTIESSTVSITWGSPAAVGTGVNQYWIVDATNTASFAWDILVSGPIDSVIVTTVQILDSVGDVIISKPLASSETYNRSGEFSLERLVLSTL